MRNVFVVSDNILSPLGENTESNMSALKEGRSGIRQHQSGLSDEPFYASLFSSGNKTGDRFKTAFEQIVYRSAYEAMKNARPDTDSKKTGFILSSTKGNIGLIENGEEGTVDENRIALHSSAGIIAESLGIRTKPLVISHACISGLLAMITGMRLIQSGVYDTLIISGGDLITKFIYAGFSSFQAISPNPCKPFDATRDGISLGEAAATIILSSTEIPGATQLKGGAVSNDANHISGPSRTGEELWMAIKSAMKQAGMQAADIDFISAHGTATRYNDEMEAKAIHLAGLAEVPVNSLKGYFGHTLGAAGLLESIVSIHAMKESILIPTRGFSIPGTEMKVNIINELKTASIQTCLKTASGFGGCNAALIIVNC
jgi:3-oxoacyl-[acyl-carrier-protein] synthase I